jgi:hypothetical protein
MTPEEYRGIVGQFVERPWLFWRCLNGHVTEMLPLP